MSLAPGGRALRLLPVTIMVCGLLLGLKGLELGLLLTTGLTHAALPGAMVTAAQAATASAHEAAPAKPESVKSGPPAPEPVAQEPAGPPPVSPAERDLLQDLRGRRVELDAREKTLTERQAVLDAAEHRLTARIAELSALQARLEQLDTERRAHDEANWAGIVKVYETMKPKEAALIFNDMEMGVLLQLMDRMKDSKAAPVLAAMQPERARLVTTQLAAKRTQSVTVPPPTPAGAS